jgi:hypothetical protein
MAEDYEVPTEMPSGTTRLTPRMPRSPNVTIWFCSWSQPGTKLLFATVTVKDSFGPPGNDAGRRILVWPTTLRTKEHPNTTAISEATSHHGSETVGSLLTRNYRRGTIEGNRGAQQFYAVRLDCR